MKTRIISGSFNTGFFPLSPVKAEKAGGANGNTTNPPPAFKPRLEPVATKRLSAQRPAPRDHAGLPASLQDWLACDAAVEIRQSGRNGTEDASHAWGMMVAESAAVQKSARHRRVFVNGM